MAASWALWVGTSLVFLLLAAGNAYVGNSLLSVGFVFVALLHAVKALWERGTAADAE